MVGGWYGDNGTHIFHVESNGFTYAIDCQSMVQWNVSTYRTRRIKRGQARLDLLTLTSHGSKAKTRCQSSTVGEEKSFGVASRPHHHDLAGILANIHRQLQTKVCTDFFTMGMMLFIKSGRPLTRAPWITMGTASALMSGSPSSNRLFRGLLMTRRTKLTK